jgi:hypothetical protein
MAEPTTIPNERQTYITRTEDEKKAFIIKETERYDSDLQEFKRIADEFKIPSDSRIFTVCDSYIFSDYTYSEIYTLILYFHTQHPTRPNTWILARLIEVTGLTLPYKKKNLLEYINYTLDMYRFITESNPEEEEIVEERIEDTPAIIQKEETNTKRCNLLSSMMKLFTY